MLNINRPKKLVRWLQYVECFEVEVPTEFSLDKYQFRANTSHITDENFKSVLRKGESILQKYIALNVI